MARLRQSLLGGWLLALAAQIIYVDYARADYENTWNLYYEPPCCTGAAAAVGHHLRHHKEHVKDFSCGPLHYKTFYMDERNNALYVGAMDRIFRLNLRNISQSICERDVLILEPTGSDILNCVSKGKREKVECRNHIRVIQPMNFNGHRLYVCGTNAHNPKDYVINANLTHLPRSQYVPGIGLGIGKCPYDPADNSTAVYVENGNPFGLPALYAGTNAEFTKADSVIFRSDLFNFTNGRKEANFKRTVKYDSKLLDKPNFVGSFDIGDFVYFFFREHAVEYINCGKAVYSRVARVCKNDRGGKYMISQNWATYLKARMNCSISSEFPFYFNEIQSVYKMPNDDSKFYATFTTNTNGLIGSAVCSYDIRDINAAFEGKFKEQATSNSAWLPVLNSKVPEPRPGTCHNDTATLPDSVLNFIRKHPLMDKAVDHEFGNPVFYKRDVILTRLVVDKIRIDKLNQEFLVYFVATSTGHIYKIVQFMHYGQRHSNLVDIFEASPRNEPIRELTLSQKTASLYLATDHQVKQIDLAMCARRYDSCFRCVADPYCGWDKEVNACRPYQLGLLQDVANETSGICDTSVLRKRVTSSYGQTLHLSCFVKMPEVLRKKQTRWYHHSTEKGRYEVRYTPTKYIETNEGGLVLLAVNEGDGGRYDSYLDGTLLCSYGVTVDAHRCSPPSQKQDYQKIYSHWCNEFEKYKSAMKQWQAKQEQCGLKDKSATSSSGGSSGSSSSSASSSSSSNGKHVNDVFSNDALV
ncbi:semaphorin-2A isoform X1 [Drosophila navojoa]|uniref:semaphorin-2A isoform X1 n=1 Tax=Drosophila navojoa TaxID=7232 RepID=UPI000846EDDC|nr:semaphorin-2A isoform X1 [Drosophila navojoa]XP_017961469.1 semaphorin-2A isoform X1 [Drosophila navojoa]XP_017961470.1 semaphorin-2A isoform X1 [Drosophila navojoa]